MTNPIWRDPIVAELHAIREQIAERFQNDLIAYSEAATAHCRALGFPIVASPVAKESRTHDSVLEPTPRNRSRGIANHIE
jgi:hypothetical protein